MAKGCTGIEIDFQTVHTDAAESRDSPNDAGTTAATGHFAGAATATGHFTSTTAATTLDKRVASLDSSVIQVATWYLFDTSRLCSLCGRWPDTAP